MKFLRKNQNICNNIVIIDGFSKSGKSMIASIFGYLNKCEQWQLDYRYEYIAALDSLNKISRDASETMINMWADNHIYDLTIGRNVNVRKTDVSSPYYDMLEKKFEERLSKQDGDNIVEEIKQLDPILPIHVHHTIGFSDLLLKGFANKLKLYTVSIRNPYKLINFFFEEQWPKRLCKDPRSFKLCIENSNGNIAPFYISEEYTNIFQSANDIEKSILTVFIFHKKMFNMIDNADKETKSKIMLIPFDSFIVNPGMYIDKICEKLDTYRVKDFDKIMKRENLPRENSMIDDFTINDFLDHYSKAKISKNFQNMLLELENMYKDLLNYCIK